MFRFDQSCSTDFAVCSNRIVLACVFNYCFFLNFECWNEFEVTDFLIIYDEYEVKYRQSKAIQFDYVPYKDSADQTLIEVLDEIKVPRF